MLCFVCVVVLQSLSFVRLSAITRTAAHQVSLSFTISQLGQTHVQWVGYAIWRSHHLLPSFPPALNLSSIRIFSNESPLCIRWPKYWSFSFSIHPSNEYSGLIPLRIDWFDLTDQESLLQPSHPAISSSVIPNPPAPNPSQHQSLFQ